jgi:hypothetical protein
LSRKDGSIIKVAGFTSAGKRSRTQSTAAYPAASATQSSEENGSADEEVPNDTNTTSPSEELAAAIFQFMKVAESLGSTLTSISKEEVLDDSVGQRSDAGFRAQDRNLQAEDSDSRRHDSQVQLLRLRVRQREIIIFPDVHYLACVVQRIGKQQGVDTR